MTNPEKLPDDTKALAKLLITGMSELQQQFAKTKKFVKWLAGSVVFDILLSVILGVVSFIAINASNKATDATSAANDSIRTQKISCESANVSRKLNRDLWGYVLTVSAQSRTEPQTPEQAVRIEQFKNYVNTVFADRDCNNLQQAPTIVLTPPIVAPVETPEIVPAPETPIAETPMEVPPAS